MRRRMPDADLDTLGAALGVSRSAVNHRLRRLVELASHRGGLMRRPVVAGNWKMNPPTADEAIALAESVEVAAAESPLVTTVICPPMIWLATCVGDLGGPVPIGAQTMHDEERGAFTGETSPLMLVGIAEFVILGHSERRQYDGETDERVGRKVASAVAHGLYPIAAVGERAEERRAGADRGRHRPPGSRGAGRARPARPAPAW